MDTYQLPEGAVLDQPMVRALLYCAIKEGLVDGDPIIGDGFVGQFLSSPPTDDLVANAFEHLVLSGKILAPFSLPREWHGELFERELVVPSEPVLEEDLIETPLLSPPLILAMLRDRGYEWTSEELMARYNTFIAKYQAWESAGGKSFDPITLFLARVGLIEYPVDYSPEALAEWNAVNEAYNVLKPVFSCHKDYRLVLTVSLRDRALSALPLDATTASVAEIPLISTSSERVSLLRIACKRLRRIPIGSSLRETIALATSPEAEDLRHKLGQWTEAVRRNQVDPAVVILDDFEKARQHLRTAKTLTQIGEYSTIIGLPAGAVGLFMAGPLVTIGGFALSVIGGVALGGQKYMERISRWAMYGQDLTTSS